MLRKLFFTLTMPVTMLKGITKSFRRVHTKRLKSLQMKLVGDTDFQQRHKMKGKTFGAIVVPGCSWGGRIVNQARGMIDNRWWWWIQRWEVCTTSNCWKLKHHFISGFSKLLAVQLKLKPSLTLTVLKVREGALTFCSLGLWFSSPCSKTQQRC